jgi:hypothetical protein
LAGRLPIYRKPGKITSRVTHRLWRGIGAFRMVKVQRLRIRGTPMAKKSKKKSAKKTTKKSAKNSKKPTSKKSKKAAAGKSPAKKKARKKAAKPAPTIGDKISGAYHAVVDSITGTDALRNKMSKAGASESE